MSNQKERDRLNQEHSYLCPHCTGDQYNPKCPVNQAIEKMIDDLRKQIRGNKMNWLNKLAPKNWFKPTTFVDQVKLIVTNLKPNDVIVVHVNRQISKNEQHHMAEYLQKILNKEFLGFKVKCIILPYESKLEILRSKS